MTGKGQGTVVLDGERLKCERERLGLKISQVEDFIVEHAKGFKGGVSGITYRRAEYGSPVFVKTARIIAAAFGVPFEELILSSRSPDPRLTELDCFLANVRLIIQTWLKEGHDGKPGELPAHPEFVYRLTDEWKGWNDFFGIPPHQREKENLFQDIFEDCAFRIVKSMVELGRLTEPAG